MLHWPPGAWQLFVWGGFLMASLQESTNPWRKLFRCSAGEVFITHNWQFKMVRNSKKFVISIPTPITWASMLPPLACVRFQAAVKLQNARLVKRMIYVAADACAWQDDRVGSERWVTSWPPIASWTVMFALEWDPSHPPSPPWADKNDWDIDGELASQADNMWF